MRGIVASRTSRLWAGPFDRSHIAKKIKTANLAMPKIGIE